MPQMKLRNYIHGTFRNQDKIRVAQTDHNNICRDHLGLHFEPRTVAPKKKVSLSLPTGNVKREKQKNRCRLPFGGQLN